MGVLEDAIRDHLELRRRHGAAEDELRDQEAEALGPVRREPEPAEVAPAERPEPPSEAPEPVVEAPVDVSYDEPTRLAEPPADVPFVGAFEDDSSSAQEVSAVESDHPETVLEEATPFHEPFAEEPLARDPTLEEEHPVVDVPDDEVLGEDPLVDQPTVIDEPPGAVEEPAGVEEAPVDEAEPPAGEEDVLEETPDFLQETPEHDRLWFEQKPPRDFDFD